MKKYARQIAAGLVLILLAGLPAGCGTPDGSMTSPEDTASAPDTATTPAATTEPEPTVSEEPEEPSYDPFDDPNVIWGNDLVSYDGTDLPVLPGMFLINSLVHYDFWLNADDDDLIAFHIGAAFYSGPYYKQYGYVVGVRARFVELGFIPLYDLEDLYAAREIIPKEGLWKGQPLPADDLFFVCAFVGTKAQIKGLKDQIDPETEGYILYSCAKNDIFGDT